MRLPELVRGCLYSDDQSHVLRRLSFFFTKSLDPVVVLFLSAVVTFSPRYTQQQVPVAFSLTESCQFLWRLSLSRYQQRWLYCSEFNLEFLESELSWWKLKEFKLCSWKKYLHQTQHFSVIFTKYLRDTYLMYLRNRYSHSSSPAFMNLSIDQSLCFIFHFLKSCSLWASRPSSTHSSITPTVSGVNVFILVFQTN